MSRRLAVPLGAALLVALSVVTGHQPRRPTAGPQPATPSSLTRSPSTSTGALPPPASAPRNARMSVDHVRGSYLRADGRTDETVRACSTGRREQNEPTVAVDPRDPSVVVAGANDYCASIVTGDAWVGYYRSADGGRTWRDSLVPGYPTDGSAAGTTSAAYRHCGAASDPTMAFDRDGRLFYGFICFNRATGRDRPRAEGPPEAEGAEAQEDGGAGGRDADGGADASARRGDLINSSTLVAVYDADGGRYVRTVLLARGTAETNEDKINLAVDRTEGPNAGNVYAAWVELAPPTSEGVPRDPLLIARSTDHGVTFSAPIPVTSLVHPRFPDLAVGPDGTVWVSFRIGDTLWVARSTDGGRSFLLPVRVASPVPFDSSQFSGGDGDDCGVGPYACPSRFVFSRFDTQAAITADPAGAHVAWNERLPNGQSKILVSSSADGVDWSDPRPLDRVPVGHQYLPDVASAGGTITVAFLDSRADRSYSPVVPPGNTAGGRSSGPAVDVFVARSTDGGRTWTEARVSRRSSNYDYLTPGRLPFWGDYLYVSAAAGAVQVAWTDSRDVVAAGDRTGFRVFEPCPRRAFVDDRCLSQGGNDQNVYTARA